MRPCGLFRKDCNQRGNTKMSCVGRSGFIGQIVCCLVGFSINMAKGVLVKFIYVNYGVLNNVINFAWDLPISSGSVNATPRLCATTPAKMSRRIVTKMNL